MKFLLLSFSILLSQLLIAQSVAINTTAASANASSILDVASTTKGFLLPRMTKAQKNAITTPATGLLVYQTSPDSVGFHYFNGTQWTWLNPIESNDWKITGNAGTDTAVNFFGTTDNMPIRFKQNNINIGEFNRNKRNYFIGNGAGNYQMIANGHISIGDSTGTNFTGTAAAGVLIGVFAGKKLINGFNPLMIGFRAGENTTSGGANVFVGSLAGRFNTIGAANTFLGHQAGDSSFIGNDNTSIGAIALSRNKKGSNNSALGYNANVGSDSLVNATVIGSLALIDTSNALVLGSINGINGATANTNVAIGTTKPKATLHISRGNAGFIGTVPSNRTLLIEDDFNSYIQMLTPNIRESGILAGSDSSIIKGGIVFSADSSISLRAGGNFERVTIQKNGNVGIENTDPKVPLHVSRGNALIGAQYNTSATAIFENGALAGNANIQLVNHSGGDYSINSGSDLINFRSGITFKKDSSIYIASGATFNERISISKGGNIGINNPSPKSLLHIAATGVNAASSYYFPENNFVVEDTVLNVTTGAITNNTHLIANNNNASSIIAGSKQNPLTSSIVFRNDDRSMRFVTNASNVNGSLTDVIIDSSGRVGIGFTNPATSFGVNGAVTFVQDITNTVNAATVTITVGNRTFFRVNSDAAPASRKLALTNGLFTGQMLIVQCIATGVNGFRIEDADTNIDINGTSFNLLVNDTITFIWDGNEWVELHRSDN